MRRKGVGADDGGLEGALARGACKGGIRRGLGADDEAVESRARGAEGRAGAGWEVRAGVGDLGASVGEGREQAKRPTDLEAEAGVGLVGAILTSTNE